MRLSVAAVLGTALLLLPAGFAQEPAKKLACTESRDSRPRQCEMREMTIGTTGRLEVDAAPNGGISVAAWSRAEVLVRAKVETWGEAKLGDVRVNATPGRVIAEGPKSMGWRDSGWSVSYEIFLPERTDLDLRSVNGGISVDGVRGELKARTTNGGMTLAAVGGKVNAQTTNGGVNLRLAGRGWEGESCEVTTTNGGVNVEIPENYAARLVASTTNGGLKSEVPNAKVEKGRWTGGTMELSAGGAGPVIKVTTTNGGVTVRHKGTAQL